MESDFDRDARTWATRISRAYAAAALVPITPETEVWLARELRTPLADCIGLAIPPADWASDFVDPALVRWEALTHRRPGPRLVIVDYANGTVAMGRYP